MLEQSLIPKTTLDLSSHAFSPENIAAKYAIVDFLRQFSEKKNATPVQISLAWLLARKRSSCRFLAHAASIT